MRTVFLVSCVSKKKPAQLPAKDLYDSPWFKKARAYVESTGSLWFILSAEYGLLEPDRIVAPYEKTLNQMSIRDRRHWSQDVLADLRRILTLDDRVVFLAGMKYREFLDRNVAALCREVEVPMQGLRIGEQLQWLDAQVSQS